jgi:predicted secreted hydrolase
LALLGTATRARAAESYPDVLPGKTLRFPRDHGAHLAYRNEWWYVTGWLSTQEGERLGVQVTFFRNRPRVAEDNPSRFAPRQLVFAHAALAEAAHGRLRHDQRASRAMFDLAGTDEETTRAWIGDWSLALEGERYVAKIPAREFSLELAFEPTQPMLLQGDKGYSRKGPLPQQASWYYSRPQLAVRGRVVVGRRAREVEGRAWLDHEWSSEVMAANAVGWDWIGINIDDGGALMAFRMRDGDGGVVWAGGARRHADGRTEILPPEAVRFVPGRRWTSPRTGFSYPVEFVVVAGGVEVALAPLMDDQELDSRLSTGIVYWEGAVTASVAGRVIGRGYLELTGYGSMLRI